MPILFNLKLISFPYISFAIEPDRALCPCRAARAAFATAWAAAFFMPSSSPERCPITSATYGAPAPASAALRSPPAGCHINIMLAYPCDLCLLVTSHQVILNNKVIKLDIVIDKKLY